MIGTLAQSATGVATDPRAAPIVLTAGVSPKVALWFDWLPAWLLVPADIAAICAATLSVTLIIIRIRKEIRDTREDTRKQELFERDIGLK